MQDKFNTTEIKKTDVYYKPVYTIRSNVSHEIFTDPMGSIKPQYPRVRLTKHLRELSDYQFDRDQIEFREDLMALQQRKNNQSNWNMLWDRIYSN